MKHLHYVLFFLLIGTFYSCDTSTPQTDPVDESSITETTPNVTPPNIEETPMVEDAASSSTNEGEVLPKKLYVLAVSGLNLRETSDSKSKVIKKVPLGKLVIRLDNDAGTNDMTSENIKGRMIKASYGSLQGYIFDGFLSQYPPIRKKEGIKEYVKRLQGMKLIEVGGSMYNDAGDHVVGLDSLLIPSQNMQEAFLLANRITPFMDEYTFPKPSREKETKIDNPKKNESVFFDQLTVNRNGKGEIIDMFHVYATEGAERTTRITRKEDGIMIKKSFGSD